MIDNNREKELEENKILKKEIDALRKDLDRMQSQLENQIYRVEKKTDDVDHFVQLAAIILMSTVCIAIVFICAMMINISLK